MRIHALYTQPHYGEHLHAIWNHIPDRLLGHTLHDVRRSVTGVPFETDPADMFMVAGFDDIERCGHHRVIYVEHGAGQSYTGVSPHRARYYHGSQHPENVVAYISPRQQVADSWGRPAFAAGAPICDWFDRDTGNTHPCAAITFHWNSRVCPETLSALPHWQEHLPALVERLQTEGFVVVGHHHPRDTRLPRIWRNMGVEVVDAATVRRCADLLIADNTSMMYEMAYLGRTVVALTAPWWRRDVTHGLRFWEAIPGTQVHHPDELLAIDFRYEIHNLGMEQAAASLAAYGRERSDGRDGMRAAMWIAEFAETM